MTDNFEEAAREHLSNRVFVKPTIHELEAILADNQTPPIELLPSGEVRPRADETEVLRLAQALQAQWNDALEVAAGLHESMNPACDHEREHGDPGAGAMGVVVEYRDAIRALKVE